MNLHVIDKVMLYNNISVQIIVKKFVVLKWQKQRIMSVVHMYGMDSLKLKAKSE